MNIHTKVTVGITLFALLGLFFVSDYGMSYDDQHNREFGLATYEFITAKLTGEPYRCVNEYCVTSKYHGLIHGPVFELPLILIEKVAQITDVHDVYLLRHYTVWLFFCFGLFLFYRLCFLLTHQVSLSILGVAWLALTPRIFADAFYNSVDIPFLVLNIATAYTLLCLLEKPSWQKTCVHGIVTGLACDIRIVAGIWVPITIGLLWYRYHTRLSQLLVLKRSLLYLGTFLGTLILCWPLLWQNPLLLVPAIREVAQFDMFVSTLFGGTLLTGPGAPWNYLPVWMSITLPLSILGVGILGYVYSLGKIRSGGDAQRIHLLLPLLWLTLPLLLVFLYNPTLYSGWRHFFFIYPAFILLALKGILFLHEKIKNNQLLKKIGTCLLIGSVIHLVIIDITYHPYENLYFNALAPQMSTPCQEYDTDYWGLSYKEIFEHVLTRDNRSVLKIYSANIQAAHFLSSLPLEERTRIRLVNSSKQADYYVTNYYEKKNMCNKASFRSMNITKRVQEIPLYTINKIK